MMVQELLIQVIGQQGRPVSGILRGSNCALCNKDVFQHDRHGLARALSVKQTAEGFGPLVSFEKTLWSRKRRIRIEIEKQTAGRLTERGVDATVKCSAEARAP